jgi:hypothetical protein
MELELGLDPDDAARLTRLAPLAPLKSGRARSRAVRIVWHDTASSIQRGISCGARPHAIGQNRLARQSRSGTG